MLYFPFGFIIDISTRFISKHWLLVCLFALISFVFAHFEAKNPAVYKCMNHCITLRNSFRLIGSTLVYYGKDSKYNTADKATEKKEHQKKQKIAKDIEMGIEREKDIRNRYRSENIYIMYSTNFHWPTSISFAVLFIYNIYLINVNNGTICAVRIYERIFCVYMAVF